MSVRLTSLAFALRHALSRSGQWIWQKPTSPASRPPASAQCEFSWPKPLRRLLQSNVPQGRRFFGGVVPFEYRVAPGAKRATHLLHSPT